MKKALILAAALLLALAMAACGNAGQPAQSSEQTESAPVAATLRIAYADEAFLAGGASFDEFADEASAYQVKVVFSTDTAVEDFKFLKLSVTEVDESGNMACAIDGELYTADTLSPQRPLVVSMAFAGALPDRGISYKDGDGSVKHYAITMSGEGDELLLTAFEK